MKETEIIYQYKDCYELQLIDCNCSNCFFMQRDLEKYKKWEDYHRMAEEKDFYNQKGKAILEAWAVIDKGEKGGPGMLRVASKMKFQFRKIGLLQYGHCQKYNKPVSFIPVTCQIETQHCFKHRKDVPAATNI